MNKLTPGPWHVGIKPGPIVYSMDGEQIANCIAVGCDTGGNMANAQAIAALPDLIEALEWLCADKYLADPINAERMAKAKRALAKAGRPAD